MEPEIFDTKMRKYGIFVAKMCKYGIFVAKICKYGIFVAKICKYGIFVAKICKYAFNDSFFRFSGSHDSAASLAALSYCKDVYYSGGDRKLLKVGGRPLVVIVIVVILVTV